MVTSAGNLLTLFQQVYQIEQLSHSNKEKTKLQLIFIQLSKQGKRQTSSQRNSSPPAYHTDTFSNLQTDKTLWLKHTQHFKIGNENEGETAAKSTAEWPCVSFLPVIYLALMITHPEWQAWMQRRPCWFQSANQQDWRHGSCPTDSYVKEGAEKWQATHRNAQTQR